jgi:branched-chain amino acid transport system permease protein
MAAPTSPLSFDVAEQMAKRARWTPLEIAFWVAAFATIYFLPERHLILTEIVIWALFALSLDLILGYGGILSLGHAAFFGIGAYAAGLLAKHGIVTEPVLALVVAGLTASLLGFVTSFLVLRGSDLTRLMVTLGVSLVLRELANRYADITGGADGLQGVTMAPVLGLFRFDLFGHTAYIYSLVVLFVLFLLARRIVNSPFGLSLLAVRGNPLRASAIAIPVNWRLVAIYTLAAGYAGIAGGLLAQTTAFASLEVFSFDRSADVLLVLIIGGIGYLYGGLIGAVVFRLMQDWLANITPQYWQFWIGLVLVLIVLIGRDRMGAWIRPVRGTIDSLGGRLRIGATGGERYAMSDAPGTTAYALETVDLEKSFGGLKATNQVSLRVKKGARHALIGPNGAGKTTVINLLSGAIRPTAGRILLDGQDITFRQPHQRVRLGIARTFQINQLFGDLTPVETLGLAISERNGMGHDWWRVAGRKAAIVDEIGELLSRFDLKDVMGERTATLPYGKQRLLEIALAFACKPRVLLLDEPAAGVPDAERDSILETVAALPADVTVLLIEHDMDIVFSFADRISVLVNGELFMEGTPEQVAADPRVKAVYLGEGTDA